MAPSIKRQLLWSKLQAELTKLNEKTANAWKGYNLPLINSHGTNLYKVRDVEGEKKEVLWTLDLNCKFPSFLVILMGLFVR